MAAIARYSDEEVGFLQTFNIHRDNYVSRRIFRIFRSSNDLLVCDPIQRWGRGMRGVHHEQEARADRRRVTRRGRERGRSRAFVPVVRVRQTPGFGETNWHSDANMVPLDTNRFVTLWLPLRPLQEDDAALVFASGSHRDFALPYWHTLEGEEDLESFRGSLITLILTDLLLGFSFTRRDGGSGIARVRHRIVRTVGPRRLDRARRVVSALVPAAARGRAAASRAERVLFFGRRQAVDGNGGAPEAGAARGGRVELRGLARRRQGWGGGEAPGVAGGVPLSRRVMLYTRLVGTFEGISISTEVVLVKLGRFSSHRDARG